MKMLDYLYEHDLIQFKEGVFHWEDAVVASCQKMIEKSIITDAYAKEIIECIHEHGPYIVLIPGVAMPHSTDTSDGVLGTGIGFTKFQQSVSFDETDLDKDAKLFFTLAAKNYNKHCDNISKLSNMLMCEGVVDDLMKINNIEDYIKLKEKYKEINEGD